MLHLALLGISLAFTGILSSIMIYGYTTPIFLDYLFIAIILITAISFAFTFKTDDRLLTPIIAFFISLGLLIYGLGYPLNTIYFYMLYIKDIQRELDLSGIAA
jgi:hypothetical protein